LRLATRAWGDEGRPPAVLLHGLTGSSRTWWRVGPWFARRGWRVVAVDLRGHGGSPRASGNESLADLAADVSETLTGILDPGERIDVLLGHSLGALTALELCGRYGDLARRVVLEDPPGSESTDAEETAREMEGAAARAGEDPEAMKRERLAENPSWDEEDAEYDVAGLLDCDPRALISLRRALRWDLTGLVGSLEIPALLVLGSEGRGSALPQPERSAVAGALRAGAVEVLDAGHNVHRDDFDGYVRVLGDWLEGPGA
jgi:pimeloyl-ACP methyl ester carboxylesterase